MAYFAGTLIPSPIVKGSSGNTYGTHHSVLGIGGFMEVRTVADRNAIPVDIYNDVYFDGLSSGQRRLGMLVHVYEDNVVYHLQPPVAYSIWSGYTSGQKISALADNNNWVSFFSSSSLTAAGECISKTFTQLTHGFIKGSVIGYNKSIGLFQKSTISNASTFEPLGIVSEIINANSFTLTFSGYIDTTSITDYVSTALSAGTVYYISNIAGKLSAISPTGLYDISKPMLATLSGGTKGIVLQYRGKRKFDDGVSYSVFNPYSANTQTFLDKTITGATNIGYFTGYTGQQRLGIDAYGSTNDGNYVSLYNYYYRDTNGIIRIGAPESGIKRRGFLRNTLPAKSWVWNTYTGNSNHVGWIIVDGNISESVGLGLSGITYTNTPYNQVTFTHGVYYNNGGDLVFQVTGSTTTGTTYLSGGPIFSNKSNSNLNLRTILSKNEEFIKVTHDDNFIYISGATQSNAITTANNGLTKVGQTVSLGGDLIGSGTTLIKDTYGIGVKYSDDYKTTFVDRSLVDKGYVDYKVNTGNYINVTGTSYFVTQSDNNVGGRSTPSGCTIFLPPSPYLSHKVVVFDKDGIAGAAPNNNITVNGNGKLILDWNVAAINTNFGSITFLYNGTFWNVIAFTASPSYSF